MRTVTRLFASVKSGRFLEPGNPTGLTGLVTHPTPRSTLIAIYGATLDRLKQIPEHSVYRQSVEAITRHRLNAIESVKPKGYDEWVRRAEEKVENNPDAFRSFGPNVSVHTVNAAMVANTYSEEEDEREVEWDGESTTPSLEGVRSLEERAYQKNLAQEIPHTGNEAVGWEPEPPLEASQIQDVENQIAAGLIEEVIEVAEGEYKLIDTLAESKVWTELEERAPEGQWAYYGRDQHTLPTQSPPVDKKH